MIGSENEAGIDIRNVSSQYGLFDWNKEHTHVFIPSWLEEAFIDSKFEYIHRNKIVLIYIDLDLLLPSIREKYVLDHINAFFWFSKWYSMLELEIPTPKSIIVDLRSKNLESNINQAILEVGGEAFIRLDFASSKNLICHTDASTVLPDLLSSKRTAFILKNKQPHNLIVRTYIKNIQDYYEIRCFIKDKTLRGISGPQGIESFDETKQIEVLKTKIKKFISRIVIATEYNDCVIDILLSKKEFTMFIQDSNVELNLLLLEINEPCSLHTASGLFNLFLPRDVTILLGAMQSFITYPIMLMSDETSKLLEF